MPGKRSTKKNSVKPIRLPVGTSDGDLSHEDQDRERQKEMMLKEFDTQVSEALKDMEKQKKCTVLAIGRHFEALIAAIPSELKHLTWNEFADMGGTYEKAMSGLMRSNRLKELDALKLKCTAGDLRMDPGTDKSNSGKDIVKGEEKENEDKLTDLGTVQTQMRGKKRTKRAIRTPAITPKFDPNDNSTPENVRDMLPGETLMSIAGSPVRTLTRPGGRETIKPMQVKETLIECGLSPTRIGDILETLATKLAH